MSTPELSFLQSSLRSDQPHALKVAPPLLPRPPWLQHVKVCQDPAHNVHQHRISAGSVHILLPWIDMHSTALFLCWEPPCPHSHHETAAVQHMLCDLKQIHKDVWFTDNHTYLSLLLHGEVSSADELDGGQNCRSE